MDSNELSARIKSILVERLFLDIAPDQLGDQESLTIKYGVDSVRLFDMVVGLEDDFGICFADDELRIANFDSVAVIAGRVAEKLKK